MRKESLHNGLRRAFGALFLLLIAAAPLRAQYESFGTEPLRIQWQQIKGANYDVIFPQGMDSLARRYLYLFEASRNQAGGLMRIEVPKVPLILHPYALSPVSSPAWAPKRLELFTTPTGAEHFALNHERYLALRNNVRLAFMGHYESYAFNVLKYVYGQQSVAFGVGFKPTVWQAVSSADSFVSDMTLSGPGRNAEYLMFWRAAFVTGDWRLYDHWHFGSYQRYMPDDKSMGYLLVSDIRLFDDRYYGIGDATTIQMRDWWDLFGVWNRSFLEATGRTVRKHWRNVACNYAPLWYDQDLQRAPFTPNEPLLGVPKIYTEYHDLAPTSAGLFATQRGYNHANRLVRLDEAGGVHRHRAFSRQASRIVTDGVTLYWSEIVPDARYELVEYSVLRSYDTQSHKTRTLTRRTRLFNPSVTPEGGQLWAVEQLPEGGSAAVLVDAATGDEEERIEAPQGCTLVEVLQVGETLYATGITEAGMALMRFAPASLAWSCADDDGLLAKPRWQTCIAPQNSYLQQLSRLGDDLCFVSDQDGVNGIYRYGTSDGRVTEIVHSRFGAFHPVESDGALYYSDYDVKGHRPVRTPLGALSARPATLSGDRAGAFAIADREAAQAAAPLAAAALSPEEDAALRAAIDTLTGQPYRRRANLFKLHSWAPFYASVSRAMASKFEPIYQLINPGFTLLSQNELGTMVATMGYGWHYARFQKGSPRHSFHSAHFSMTYSGLYPVFDFNVDFNDRYCNDIGLGGDPVSPTPPPTDFNTTRPSLDISLRTSIPWNFSRGGWQRGLTPELTLYFSNERIEDVGRHHDMPLLGWTAGLSGYTRLEKARRHLSPRLGLGGAVRYSEAAWVPGDPAYSRVLSARLYGWLPGILPSHSLRIDMQGWRDFGLYNSTSAIGGVDRLRPRFPRGYESALAKTLDLEGVATASLDYGFTIPLGDITWPWLYYLMRLQVVPFADVAVSNSVVPLPAGAVLSDSAPRLNQWTAMRAAGGLPTETLYGYRQLFGSFGADILVNAHFFRIGAELNLGVRVAFPYNAAPSATTAGTSSPAYAAPGAPSGAGPGSYPLGGTGGFRAPTISFILSNNL